VLFISWVDPLVRTFILIEDKVVLLLITRYIATIAIEVRFAISPITASATMASFALTATVVISFQRMADLYLSLWASCFPEVWHLRKVRMTD